MRRSLTVSLLGIVAVALVALVATLAGGSTPRLGLDLQGGASIVLKPASAANSGAINQAVKIINERVNGAGVSAADITRQGSNIVVELPGVKNAADLLGRIGQTAELQFRAVLSDSSGQPYEWAGPGPSAATAGTTTTTAATASTTTSPPTTAGAPATTSTSATATTTKGAFGRPQVATAAMSAAAPAAFPAAAGTPTTAATPATTVASSPTTAVATPTTTAVSGSTAGPPVTPDARVTDTATVVLPQYDNSVRYGLGPVLLKGNIVSSAQAQIDPNTGQWYVQVNFTGSGGAQFDNVIAKGYYQKQVAIVLDNKVESAPTINAQQFNGAAQISGGSSGFSHSQASNLALVLRYGALPVKLVPQQVETVSASLGHSSLRAGLIAGFIGLALVLLYMIFYYRALGLIVVLGLGLSASLLYSLVTYLGSSSLHQALTLSGVVGIIVSVGVTVDSYIVYFERLKDDIRAGKTIRSSVDRSFARAWRTIWTADLVSIIAAFLLYWLTIGDVRGFAFFLGLSTLLDLLVSYTFTRPMVFYLGRNRTFTEARVLGVARGLASTAGGAA